MISRCRTQLTRGAFYANSGHRGWLTAASAYELATAYASFREPAPRYLPRRYRSGRPEKKILRVMGQMARQEIGMK